jgi:hypothetical protein
MLFSGAWGKMIHKKNLKQKISWHCPFKKDCQKYFYWTGSVVISVADTRNFGTDPDADPRIYTSD